MFSTVDRRLSLGNHTHRPALFCVPRDRRDAVRRACPSAAVETWLILQRRVSTVMSASSPRAERFVNSSTARLGNKLWTEYEI